MSNGNNTNGGVSRHWKLAGVGGVVVAVVYAVLTGSGIGASVLIGALFTGVAGFVMGRNAEDATDAATAPAAAPVVETIVDAVVEPAQDVVETIDTPAPAAQTLIKPSTALPGQAELAGRKGSWRYDANSATA